MSHQIHKGLAAFWVIIIIFLVLMIGFGGWLFWRFVWSEPNTDIPINLPGEANVMTTAPSGKIEANLVGTWESECLVPAPTNSKYAEKHKFVINADGTAEHWRWTYGMIDCTTLQPASTIDEKFNLAFPGGNKINFTWTSYKNSMLEDGSAGAYGVGVDPTKDFTGASMYDIYETNGISLKFGHGFRNSSESTGGSGGSEADRFTTLNNYIVYKKK